MVDSGDQSDRVPDGNSYQRVATFRFWYDDGQWEWNPEAARLDGYTPGTITPTTELLAAHKHPDDRASFLTLVDEMRARRTRFRVGTASSTCKAASTQ